MRTDRHPLCDGLFRTRPCNGPDEVCLDMSCSHWMTPERATVIQEMIDED